MQKKYQKISHIRAIVVILIALFSLTFGMEAMAKPDPKPTPVKVLVKDAAAAYEKGDFDTALAKFNEAYAAKEDSSLLYNIGRVYESKADYPHAVEYYKRFIATPGSDEDARTDAKKRIKDIQDTMDVLGWDGGKNAKPAPVGAAPAGAAPAGGCIDINSADVSQLVALKGVGKATADKIVAARPYRSVDELNKVKGLGDAKIDKMRDQICPIGEIGVKPDAPKPPVAAPDAPKKAPKAKASKSDGEKGKVKKLRPTDASGSLDI